MGQNSVKKTRLKAKAVHSSGPYLLVFIESNNLITKWKLHVWWPNTACIGPINTDQFWSESDCTLAHYLFVTWECSYVDTVNNTFYRTVYIAPNEQLAQRKKSIFIMTVAWKAGHGQTAPQLPWWDKQPILWKYICPPCTKGVEPL